MHFHPGWSGPAEGFGHGGYYAGDNRYGYIVHQQDKKTGQSRMPNWIIRFSRRQQLFLVTSTSEKHRRIDLLLIDPGADMAEERDFSQ
jgi:hypothetical protein